ncbi:MAG: hypothetical protein MJ240_05870 [Kiritimatiellae bacterium]|nr:hypothetical protein [Kiritimatiellia bacterium]
MKVKILAGYLTRMLRQICEMQDFHCYVLAAGLKVAFMRYGRWCRTIFLIPP